MSLPFKMRIAQKQSASIRCPSINQQVGRLEMQRDVAVHPGTRPVPRPHGEAHSSCVTAAGLWQAQAGTAL